MLAMWVRPARPASGYFTIALLAQVLTARNSRRLRARYIPVLDQEECAQGARAGLAAEDNRMRWFADHRAPQPRLRAFPDRKPDAGD